MLTIFAAPKPFRGHIGTIQRNAVASWLALEPGPQVILFGDEDGIAEAAGELAVRHVPAVARTDEGTPLLDDVFGQAQHLAANDVLLYANADIVLLSDLPPAVERVRASRERFMLVGRRWDLDVTERLDTSAPGWEQALRRRVRAEGRPRTPHWIDWFAFPRGLFDELLPLALGRVGFDNWLLWRAVASGAALVDASAVVLAVHQNHDYSHHVAGQAGVWEGTEARRNRELAGGRERVYYLTDATHRLTRTGLRPNLGPSRLWRHLQRHDRLRPLRSAWYGSMTATQPLRRRLGLRREPIAALRRRVRGR